MDNIHDKDVCGSDSYTAIIEDNDYTIIISKPFHTFHSFQTSEIILCSLM